MIESTSTLTPAQPAAVPMLRFTRDLSTAHILVVDDSPDNLYLIQMALEDEGYHLHYAPDGPTALDQILHRPPDLLLLDVMMPEMNGVEVTQRIRSIPTLPFIPILLVTAHEQPSLVRGLDAGADDFIRKPFQIDELLARVRALLRLKFSLDAQQQIIRQRDDFVSRLTHDLRTPLVAMDRMLTLLQQGAFGEIPSSAQDAVDSIGRNNQNLLQMANTLLEIYRHEAGRKRLVRSQVDLEALAQEVVQELFPLAEEKGLKLFVTEGNPEDDTPDRFKISGDRMALRRTLTNLVGNGIKFTDRGHVCVRLWRSRSETHADPEINCSTARSWVQVEVEDTGPGISPQEQRTLFDWFSHGHHLRSGSGLGLHLCHRIAKAHQGLIDLRSVVGQGSTFVLWLPAPDLPS